MHQRTYSIVFAMLLLIAPHAWGQAGSNPWQDYTRPGATNPTWRNDQPLAANQPGRNTPPQRPPVNSSQPPQQPPLPNISTGEPIAPPAGPLGTPQIEIPSAPTGLPESTPPWNSGSPRTAALPPKYENRFSGSPVPPQVPSDYPPQENSIGPPQDYWPRENAPPQGPPQDYRPRENFSQGPPPDDRPAENTVPPSGGDLSLNIQDRHPDRSSGWGGAEYSPPVAQPPQNPPGEPRLARRETFPAAPAREEFQPAAPPEQNVLPPRNPPPPTPPFANAPALPDKNLVSEAQIVARVGDQPILLGDLLGRVNEVLAPYAGQAPPDQIEAQRQILIRQLLPVMIETKLIYHDFMRSVPKDKVSELNNKLNEQFDKSKLETDMEKAGVTTPAELDAHLRKFGSSLMKSRQEFAEQALAISMLRRTVNLDPIITHEDMRRRYYDNGEQYEFAAAVKWEQLSADFKKYPSKRAAWQAIADMGNEVLHGAPLSAVAKRQSSGITADEGGAFDWTTQGSLVSVELDEAIFSLPEGKLSRIIEDEKGFHIVRVIKRREAGKVSFEEAQEDIRKEIRRELNEAAKKEYLEKLKKETPVWTIFDDEPPLQTAQP